MDRRKIMLTGIVAIVLAVFLASPTLAHRKYRPHHKGLPRWVQVRHSHGPSESAKSAAQTQSEAKGFDLLGGAAEIVTGTLKTLGNVVETVFGGKAESTGQTQKIESRKGSSLHRNYRFVPRHPSGSPTWVRKRIY